MFSQMFLLFYSLLLVFSRNRYLLVSYRKYIVHLPPCFWNRTRGFLKSKTLVGTYLLQQYRQVFSFPNLAEGVCCERPLDWSYLSFSQKSSSWHYLALAKLRSIAQAWNHQRIFNSWIKVDCRLSEDSFLAHASIQGDMRPFLATMLRSGIFNLRKVVL
jgi:hypothetical protein